jgi:hypothetical protein
MFNYAKSFLSSGTNPNDLQNAKQPHPATNLFSDLTISDSSRHALKIFEAPFLDCGPSDLAVMTDNLGRVFLIDTDECQVIRMWKGMRDAQCAWAQVAYVKKDESSETSSTVILLLLIYCSRGILEVYNMRHGERILILQVGGGLKLLQASGCVLGKTSTESGPQMTYSRCFLLGLTGELSEVVFNYDAVLSKFSNGQKVGISRLCDLYSNSENENQRLKHLESMRNLIRNGDKNLAEDVILCNLFRF